MSYLKTLGLSDFPWEFDCDFDAGDCVSSSTAIGGSKVIDPSWAAVLRSKADVMATSDMTVSTVELWGRCRTARRCNRSRSTTNPLKFPVTFFLLLEGSTL